MSANARELIEETLRLRAEATQGEWILDPSFGICYFSGKESIKVPISNTINWEYNERLMVHAANNIEKLCKALEVALDGLEELRQKRSVSVDHSSYDNIDTIATELNMDITIRHHKMLQEIESIIAGGGE